MAAAPITPLASYRLHLEKIGAMYAAMAKNFSDVINGKKDDKDLEAMSKLAAEFTQIGNNLPRIIDSLRDPAIFSAAINVKVGDEVYLRPTVGDTNNTISGTVVNVNADKTLLTVNTGSSVIALIRPPTSMLWGLDNGSTDPDDINMTLEVE